MAELLDSVENSVWHAFDFMALEGNGTVTKTKLKVGRHLRAFFLTINPYMPLLFYCLLIIHSCVQIQFSRKTMTLMAPILKIVQ